MIRFKSDNIPEVISREKLWEETVKTIFYQEY